MAISNERSANSGIKGLTINERRKNMGKRAKGGGLRVKF